MVQNICHFTPYHKDYHSIHTINFVFETKPQEYKALKTESVYKIHFVCSGKGRLHVAGKEIPLHEGDVFFTFPAVPFCIESAENFSYMYISFLGSRANMIMDNMSISPHRFIFSGCGEIYEFWKNGLCSSPETTDLIAESILLYTFHFLGNKIISLNVKRDLKEDISLKIKKYIDDNFSEHEISLKTISDEFSYSQKYVSSVFKKSFKVGISEYLSAIRIQNACTLIAQGFASVSDISNRCGYADPQYFSKVFKQKTGFSPKIYIKSMSKQC